MLIKVWGSAWLDDSHCSVGDVSATLKACVAARGVFFNFPYLAGSRARCDEITFRM